MLTEFYAVTVLFFLKSSNLDVFLNLNQSRDYDNVLIARHPTNVLDRPLDAKALGLLGVVGLLLDDPVYHLDWGMLNVFPKLCHWVRRVTLLTGRFNLVRFLQFF